MIPLTCFFFFFFFLFIIIITGIIIIIIKVGVNPEILKKYKVP